MPTSSSFRRRKVLVAVYFEPISEDSRIELLEHWNAVEFLFASQTALDVGPYVLQVWIQGQSRQMVADCVVIFSLSVMPKLP